MLGKDYKMLKMPITLLLLTGTIACAPTYEDNSLRQENSGTSETNSIIGNYLAELTESQNGNTQLNFEVVSPPNWSALLADISGDELTNTDALGDAFRKMKELTAKYYAQTGQCKGGECTILRESTSLACLFARTINDPCASDRVCKGTGEFSIEYTNPNGATCNDGQAITPDAFDNAELLQAGTVEDSGVFDQIASKVGDAANSAVSLTFLRQVEETKVDVQSFMAYYPISANIRDTFINFVMLKYSQWLYYKGTEGNMKLDMGEASLYRRMLNSFPKIIESECKAEANIRENISSKVFGNSVADDCSDLVGAGALGVFTLCSIDAKEVQRNMWNVLLQADLYEGGIGNHSYLEVERNMNKLDDEIGVMRGKIFELAERCYDSKKPVATEGQ